MPRWWWFCVGYAVGMVVTLLVALAGVGWYDHRKGRD